MKTLKGIDINPYKKLELNENYRSFKDFFDKNEPLIFKHLVELFDELKKIENDNTLSLYIKAKISGIQWDDIFVYSKKDSSVLINDMLPYFEKMEEYETCNKIKKLYNELSEHAVNS